jgi:hypothetical protein
MLLYLLCCVGLLAVIVDSNARADEHRHSDRQLAKLAAHFNRVVGGFGISLERYGANGRSAGHNAAQASQRNEAAVMGKG